MAENNTETNEIHTSSNNNYKLITEELVKDGLQNDKGKNAELISWEIKDFTNKGDGYTSFVTSVTVSYIKDDNEFVGSYVVKLNPERPPNPLSDLMKVMFPREKVILTDVIGAMNKYLERLSLAPIRTPRLFASNMEKGREAFVAENLRTQGFQMHDRKKSQDFHQASLVMEELGRFHASSLLLEESIAPKTFVETFEYFEEPWLDINNKFFKVLENIIVSSAEIAIKFLIAIPKYEKSAKWLKSNLKNLGRYYLDGFKSSKPFEVFIHGDCHSNNMLFKYNSKNKLVDMRLLDLQCGRISSPASDINYFVYSSLTGETRSKHFQELLYIYYQSFSKVLIFSRRKVPFTFKELEDEVEKRKLLGFIIGLISLPFVFFDSEDDVMDFGNIREDNMEEFAEKQKQTFQKLSEREGPFKDRFLSLFDEMIENNIFDEN